MRIVNGILFGIIFILFGLCIYGKRQNKKREWQIFLQTHLYILVILLVANIGSFILSFSKEESQIYVKRESYDGEEKEMNLLFKNGEEEEEVSFTVHPRIYTKKEQEEKIQEAFCYLNEHIKGNNESLSHVVENIDLSLDYEKFPFEEEVRPDDYSLVDEEGNPKHYEFVIGGFLWLRGICVPKRTAGFPAKVLTIPFSFWFYCF